MPGKPPSCILVSVSHHLLGLAKALPFPLGTFPTSASSLKTCLATPQRWVVLYCWRDLMEMLSHMASLVTEVIGDILQLAGS